MCHRNLTAVVALLAISSLFSACTSDTEPGDPNDSDESESPGELLQSSVERDESPDVGVETAEQAASDNRDFTFDLLQQIQLEDRQNIFFSPYSISSALAMTYAGASGGTHDELGDTLRFTVEEEQLHPSFNAVDLDLKTRSEVDTDGDPPTLNVVNATWAQHDYDFSDAYLDTLALHYGAGLFAVDFKSEPDATRQKINQWVEDQTEERIKDLLPPKSITRGTKMVLTNAIYFMAAWDKEFSDSATSQKPFTRLDGAEVDVDLMRQNDSFDHYLGDDTHAISLPYEGKELSLVALKPADPADFEDWEAGLDRIHFDEVLSNMAYGKGTIALPSFRFEGAYDLKELFEAMGWTNFGELLRMVDDGGHELEITDILHKSFIDVDEEGTEAAAATAVVIGDVGSAPMPPEDDFELFFDRPFYYAIYDHPTDTILFMGRLADPTVEAQ